jgi:predicted TPR repeat methyltransferase
LYRKANHASPLPPENLYKFGDSLYETRKYHEAEKTFRALIKIEPENIDALCCLGNSLHEQGKISDALACYEKALEKDPSYKYACNNLGNIYRDLGDDGKALEYFHRAVEADKKFADPYYNMGNIYRDLGKNSKAADCYRKSLKFDPANESAAHLLAAISGEQPEHAPKTYIAELFDEYSSFFDSDLVESLEYRAPEFLSDELKKACPERIFSNAIDLGCGTGLSGKAFKNVCKKLTGVDLSEGMLEKAETKAIYNCLRKGDITSFLESTPEQYDLFIAADAIIYSGNLEPLFSAVKKRAMNRAVFIFSLEAGDSENYRLQESGRYCHSAEYVISLTERSGLKIKHFREAKLRKELGKWVKGQIFVLENITGKQLS